MCAAAYYSQQRESVPVSKLLSIWRCRHTLMWWASEGLIYIYHWQNIIFAIPSFVSWWDSQASSYPIKKYDLDFMDTSVQEKINKLLS